MERNLPYALQEFSQPKEIFEAVMQGRRPRLRPGNMHGDVAQLIIECWHQEPTERPTAAAVLQRLPSLPATAAPPDLAAVDAAARQRRRRHAQHAKEASFDVFISYRVATDAMAARRLKTACVAAGLRAFLDKDDISAGEDWRKAFLRALGAATVFVPLLSNAGLEGILQVEADPSANDDNCLLEVSWGKGWGQGVGEKGKALIRERGGWTNGHTDLPRTHCPHTVPALPSWRPAPTVRGGARGPKGV